jgi:hypothetical protein
LYGAETWTLRKVDQNTWKVLKCVAEEGWRSAGPIMWEMKKYYKESRRRGTTKRRKGIWIGHNLLRNCLLKHVIEGKIKGRIEVTGRRGRRPKQLLDDLKEKGEYWKFKEEAIDYTLWRTRFRRGCGLVVIQTTELTC